MRKTYGLRKIVQRKASVKAKLPRLKSLEAQLQKVLPSELKSFASVKAITNQEIIETDEGFILTFQLTGRPGTWTLFTARQNRPRTWLSVDRMLHYLRDEGILLPTITLTVR